MKGALGPRDIGDSGNCLEHELFRYQIKARGPYNYKPSVVVHLIEQPTTAVRSGRASECDDGTVS